ncbi:hypothetical protein ACQUZF_09740, partial [Streptococcus pyogenes]
VTTSSNSDEQTTKNSNHQQSSDEKTEQSSTKVSNTNKSGYNFDYDDDTTEDTDTTDVQDLKSNGAKSQTTRATNDKQPQIASLTAQAKD